MTPATTGVAIVAILLLITILSFLPVFALSGREGKMFHPLAFTKTFALVGVALLSITLVPALIPIFLKGRIKSEEESWLVRTMIEIFQPMLSWLMDRTTLVCWLFAVILGNRNAVTITRLVTVITSFPFRLNESPPPDLLAG